MSHLTMLYGASASGKGSRVMKLIDYLHESGLEHEVVSMDMHSKKHGVEKDQQVGILFRDINLFVFGRQNSRRSESWESVDQYKMKYNHLDVFRSMSEKGVNVLADTNVMFLGRKQVTSEFYKNDLGFSSFSSVFLHQEDDEELIKRMNGRTKPGNWDMDRLKGASVYGYNNDTVKSMYELSLKEIEPGDTVKLKSANISVNYLVELFKEKGDVKV